MFISSVIVQALLKCHDSLIAASRSSRRFQRFFGGMALFASLTFCSDRFDPGFIDLTTKREHTINIPFTLISHINNTNRKIYIYTLRSTIRIRFPFIGGVLKWGYPSHHPFQIGISSYKPSSYRGYHDDYGNPQIYKSGRLISR